MNKETFTSKKTRLKKILNNYPPQHPLGNEDYKEVSDFFSTYHDGWEEKIKDGLENIVVGFSSQKSKCFQILNSNDELIEIGFNGLRKDGGENKIKTISEACRRTINPIINQFKTDNVILDESLCELSGDILTEENLEIDHYDLTFKDLVDEWINKYSVHTLHSNIVDHRFKDENLSEDFINFHNSNTHLRAVTREANIKLNRKFKK